MNDPVTGRLMAAIEKTIANHLEALRNELNRLPLTVAEPVSGTSRKVGRDWCRIQPGLQGRLLSFGGVSEDAWAWIDTRPEARRMTPFAWLHRNRIKAALDSENALTQRAAIRDDKAAYDRVYRPTALVKVNGEITEREAGILRDALRADLERIIYSGDHPHCPACVVDWEDNHITPCPDYPACSIPAPRGRHRLTWTEAGR